MLRIGQPVICRNFLTKEVFRATVVARCRFADTCWWVRRLDSGRQERMYCDELVPDRGELSLQTQTACACTVTS